MFDKNADEKTLTDTVEALKKNGFGVMTAINKGEAKEMVIRLIPEGSEVMLMTSVTLEETGIAKHIRESGKYVDLKTKMMGMDKATQGKEMRAMGAAPDYAVGSMHAVTTDGQLVIASNTGSQLPAYAYGAGKVIFVAGTQKIVKDMEEARKRVYEYVLPLESERAHKAYGVPGSYVSKLLTITREVNPERITVVLVNEKLGF